MKRLRDLTVIIGAMALALVMTSAAQAQPDRGQPSTPTTTTHIPDVAIPFSSLASPEAKKAYLDLIAHPYPTSANIDEFRRGMDTQFFGPQLARFKVLYPVDIRTQTDRRRPRRYHHAETGRRRAEQEPRPHQRSWRGVRHRRRRLNQRPGSRSIPIASLGRFKVISIDYRMFPEHKFPAASEDVAAVYTELLKQYNPENIGIYGCSAGGILTAQSVAWFQKHDLPRPGAIGIICASAGGFGQGDSGLMWPLNPTQSRAASGSSVPASATGYMAGTDPKDPLVAPVFSSDVLRKFPPTLIITSTRAAGIEFRRLY